MGGQGGESACERWTSPMRRQESMQATSRHDTKRLLISVHIYIYTHMTCNTHAVQTYQSIRLMLIRWVTEGEMDRTKFGCTTYRRHKSSSLAQIQIYNLYVIWAGGRAVDMSRGEGGQGETTFICGRVVEMRSDCISAGEGGGSATCSDGDA